MSIKDLKFKENDFLGKDVTSLPDDPSNENISAQELKERFDNVAKKMIALGAFNELIDALSKAEGALEIGTTSYKGKEFNNVQKGIEVAIDYVDEKIQAIGAGDMAKADYVDAGGSGIVFAARKLVDKFENELSVKSAANYEVSIAQGNASEATAYTITNTKLEGLAENNLISVKFDKACKANATLDINETGAKPIKIGGVALKANDIQQNFVYSVYYDGTNYQISKLPSAINAELLGGKAESALNVANAAKLGGKAESALSVSYAANAGSAADATARTAAKNAQDAAKNAIPKTAISGYIDDGSKSNVASAYLTNWLWQNLQTKVAKSGDTMSGSLTSTGGYFYSNGFFVVNENQRVDKVTGSAQGLGNFNCVRLGAYGSGNSILLESTGGWVITNSSIFPTADNALYLGHSQCFWKAVFARGGVITSCGSNEKKLIKTVDMTGNLAKGRSAVPLIPIEEIRDLINKLEIHQFHRFTQKEVKPEKRDESGNLIEKAEYTKVIDEENPELGIFLDSVDGHSQFNLIGKKFKNENNEDKYLMNVNSYTTLALTGVKDSLNRIDALETKANRYDKLCDLLVSKGIVTQEEINTL